MSIQVQTLNEDKVTFLQGRLFSLLSEREQCPYSSNESFSCFIQKFIKMRKMNAQKFCNRTGLSPQIFTRLKDDKYLPSLSSIVAICVALDISYESAERLIRIAGYAFTNSIEHSCYKIILMHSMQISVDDANEFLVAQGLKPISDRDLYSKKINSSSRNEIKSKKPFKNCTPLKIA